MHAYSLRLCVYETDRPTWTDMMSLAATSEPEAVLLAHKLLVSLWRDERYEAHLLDRAGAVVCRVGGTIRGSQGATDP